MGKFVFDELGKIVNIDIHDGREHVAYFHDRKKRL